MKRATSKNGNVGDETRRGTVRGDASKQVADYLAKVPKDARAALQNLRKTIQSAAPDAVDTISYGMPAFKYRGHPLVSYAAFKNHCSLFPMSPAVLEAHKDDLDGFQTAKGTIQFTTDRPLPAVVVKKIVRARIKESDARWT